MAAGVGDADDERDTWRQLQEFWFQAIPLGAVRPSPIKTADEGAEEAVPGSRLSLGMIALAGVIVVTLTLVFVRLTCG